MEKSTVLFYLFNGLLIATGLVLIIVVQSNKIQIEKLEVGDKVTALNLISLQDSVSIIFNSEVILKESNKRDAATKDTYNFIGLFIYSDICEACNINFPNWMYIRNESSFKTTFYPINMSVDEDSLGIISSFDKYYIPSSTISFAENYKVPGVPYTVILSMSGVVEYSKIGLIDKNERKKILHVLK